ncbi:hypothetical protein [uncultured Sphingomonas sp.]|uniref:hypothetical protein n=1 Tax=uncultured Sphingomonas sp. TaxID=158754 RepID=UPI0035C9E4AF
MMLVKAILTAVVATVALSLSAPASAKVARCVIRTADASYKGPCSYSAGKGGTFTLKPMRGRFLISGIMMITVYVDPDGEGQVSGLTGAGANSRWGDAKRSRRDGACWVGADFSVCAY